MTGTQPKCGPTLADKYYGYSSAIANLLGRGFVVVFPDYQGLGLDGQAPHSAVDATTLGNTMIDAARAAHRVLPSSSTQWAAYGLGEGGLAAWAAAERAGTYGGGMTMVGAVALSPFADMSPLVDAAERGELSGVVDLRNYIWSLAESREPGSQPRLGSLSVRGWPASSGTSWPTAFPPTPTRPRRSSTTSSRAI